MAHLCINFFQLCIRIQKHPQLCESLSCGEMFQIFSGEGHGLPTLSHPLQAENEIVWMNRNR